MLLGSHVDTASRIAFAPVFGVCLGTCAMTTLLWIVPASSTYYLVPIAAAASLGLAVRIWQRKVASLGSGEERRGKIGSAGTLLSAVQILVVVLAVAGPINYAFAARSASGRLVIESPTRRDTSQRSTRHSISRYERLSDSSGRGPRIRTSNDAQAPTARAFQELGAARRSAPLNVDDLLSLSGSDTQSSFLVAFVIAGALAMYGAVRQTTKRRSWFAVLAGGLLRGAFFLQLFFDGSEGALLGLSINCPLGVAVSEAVRSRRIANYGLVALLLSALIGLYPLFVPAVVGGGGGALIAMCVLAYRRGTRPDRRSMGRGGSPRWQPSAGTRDRPQRRRLRARSVTGATFNGTEAPNTLPTYFLLAEDVAGMATPDPPALRPASSAPSDRRPSGRDGHRPPNPHRGGIDGSSSRRQRGFSWVSFSCHCCSAHPRASRLVAPPVKTEDSCRSLRS